MSVTEITVPDHIGAIITYLREQPVITDLVRPEDVTARLPLTEDTDTQRPLPPRNHLSVVKNPSLRHLYLPLLYQDVEFRCYGKTGFHAMQVWRALHSVLFPAGKAGIPAVFTRYGARITDIEMSLGPFDTSEQLWPLVTASYIFSVQEVLVATP